MSHNILAMAYADYTNGLINAEQLETIRQSVAQNDHKPSVPVPSVPETAEIDTMTIFGQHPKHGLIQVGNVATWTKNNAVYPSLGNRRQYILTAQNAKNFVGLTNDERSGFAIARNAQGQVINKASGRPFYWANGGRFERQDKVLSMSRYARNNNLPPELSADAIAKIGEMMATKKPVENTTNEPDPIGYTLSVNVPTPSTVENDDKRSSLTVWLQDTIPSLVSDKWIEYGFSADDQARLARSAKARLVAHGHTLPDKWMDRKYAFLIDQAVKAKLLTLTK